MEADPAQREWLNIAFRCVMASIEQQEGAKHCSLQAIMGDMSDHAFQTACDEFNDEASREELIAAFVRETLPQYCRARNIELLVEG